MSRAPRLFAFVFLFTAMFAASSVGKAQEQAALRGEPEMSLRKSVQVREFRGGSITGEERQIGQGDSLWRILIKEKGLQEGKFRSYLVVIRGLNPQVRNLDLLRIGDKVFIPLRLDEIGDRPSTTLASDQGPDKSALARTFSYQVKPGESLYRILREQLKLSELRELAQHASLVKDLNPQRKGDWDTLLEGEVIYLPTPPGMAKAANAESAAKPATATLKPDDASKVEGTPPVTVSIDPPLQAPARKNLPLFGNIVAAIGSEIQMDGEETITLPDGTVRFDKSTYPVVYNSVLRQRVVIDPDGNIPASLRAKLNDPNVGTPVLPMADGVSLQKAVTQLLGALGYKPLPAERPVVVQEGGIAFEAKGDWMALAPEQSNKPQDILVINLTDGPDEVPEYLRGELAALGLNLRAIILPGNGAVQPKNESAEKHKLSGAPIKNWPADKIGLVDAVLFAFGVPFGVAETLSVEVREGLSMDVRTDRIFELHGSRTALFFQAMDPVIRKSMEERWGVRIIELDLASLSSRDLIARMLAAVGDPAVYREHRFAAAQSPNQDKLTLKAWGFNLPNKAMFVTDRQIPATLHRFFFEKGLEIVYFQ